MCLLLPGMGAEVLKRHSTRSNQHVKLTRLICKFAGVFIMLVALVGVSTS